MLSLGYKKIMIASPLKRNISLTLGRQMLAAFAQFLVVVMVARQLGPEGNGFYAMAVLVPTLLVNFLNLGIGPATVYYVSRGEFLVHQVFSGNLRLAFVVSGIGVLISLIIVSLFGHKIFPGVPAELLYFGVISFPIMLYASYLNTILQGVEDFKAFNLTILLPPYVNLVGVFLVLYCFEFGVFGVMAAFISGQISGLVVTFILLLKRNVLSSSPYKPLPFRDYCKKALGYGWKSHLSNILAFVNYRADILLVNFFLTPFSTGIYIIAVQISEKLWMLSKAASTVLLPKLSAMYKEPKERLKLTKKGFIVVSSLTAATGLVVAFILYWFMSLIFGEQYEESWPVYLWLLPGIIAGAGARIQSNCIAAAGKPEWNFYAAVLVVAINITLNLLLIPIYGIVGAALATSLAYIMNAILKLWLVKKTLSL